MKSLAFLFTSFVSILTMAQDQAQQTLPSGMQSAQHILDQMNNGWVMTAAIFLVELLLRTFKTKEPKSLLYMLENLFKMIGQACNWMAQLLDSVLQRLKDDPPAQPPAQK